MEAAMRRTAISLATTCLMFFPASQTQAADDAPRGGVVPFNAPEYVEFREILSAFGRVKPFEINSAGRASTEIWNNGDNYFVSIPSSSKNKACSGNCGFHFSACNQGFRRPAYEEFSEWSNEKLSYLTWNRREGTCLSMDVPAYGEPVTDKKINFALKVWMNELDDFFNTYRRRR
jgi:hypothetical protein